MSQFFVKMKRLHEQVAQSQAEAYAANGIEAGAVTAPGPEKTKTSTGRARMSLTVASNTPANYDPGKIGSYSIPSAQDGLRGITGRRPFDEVVISMGVEYDIFFLPLYPVMPAAHAAGTKAARKARPSRRAL